MNLILRLLQVWFFLLAAGYIVLAWMEQGQGYGDEAWHNMISSLVLGLWIDKRTKQ
jgi:predicted small integral membrane protein